MRTNFSRCHIDSRLPGWLLLAGVVLFSASPALFAEVSSEPAKRSTFQRFIDWFRGGPEVSFAAQADPILAALTLPERDAALQRTAQSAAQRAQPRQWDAAFFLPATTLERALNASLKRARLEVAAANALDFHIDETKFRSSYGEGEVAITLNAGIRGTRARMDVVATGSLLYQGFTPGEKNGQAIFFVAIKALHPKRGGNISAVLGAGVGEVLTRALKEHLVIKLPIPTLALDTGLGRDPKAAKDPAAISDEKDAPVIKTAKGGELRLQLELQSTRLTAPIAHVAALFVPSGLWIGVSQTTLTLTPVPKNPQMDTLLASYQSAASANPQLFLKGAAIEAMARQAVKQLSAPETRTLRVYAVSHSGDLVKEEWSDKVLGKGGTRVTLHRDYDFAKPSADGPSGEAVFSLTEPKWTEQGMNFSATIKAGLRAPLYVHVDPLITGGLGGPIGVQGGLSSPATVSGRLEIKIATAGGNARGLAIQPVLQPGELDFQLTSDGKFKVGEMKLKAFGGWTKIPGFTISVPKFGGKMTLPLGADTLPPFVLLNNAPREIKINDPKAGADTPVKLIAAANPYLVFEPQKCVTTADGISVEADGKVAALSSAQAAGEAARIENSFKAMQRIKLPKPGNLAIMIGDLEFSESNDLWKAIRNIAVATEKAAKDVATNAEKAYKDTAKAAEKAANDIGATAEKTYKDTINTAEKTYKDAVKPLKQARDWVNDRLGW